MLFLEPRESWHWGEGGGWGEGLFWQKLSLEGSRVATAKRQA